MQTIQNPKHTVYLAASWNDEHEDMNLHIAELLAAHGLVVVGDHRDYRDAPHERGLDYRSRVDEILGGCSGMVLVFPKQHWAQTTSCRMFLEFLLAAKHKLPILLFIEDGVEAELQRANDSTSFIFGGSRRKNDLSVTLADIKKTSFRASLLNDIHEVVLPTPSFLNEPVWLSPNRFQRDSRILHINNAIEAFLNALPSEHHRQYVFLISPYSRSSQRQIIAETIFKETGLASVNASDQWGGAPYSSADI